MRELRNRENKGTKKEQTYEEFLADPLGEKKRIIEAQKTDEKTMMEGLNEKFKIHRTKQLVNEMQYEAKKEKRVIGDKRFQKLFGSNENSIYE